MGKLTGHWIDAGGRKWFVVEKDDGSIAANSDDGHFTAADKQTFSRWQSWGWKPETAGRAALSEGEPCPKCTSWLGHKYEGRYSQTASTSWPKFDTNSKEMARELLNATRDKTYERDICVRCGHVVEKKP